MADAWSTKPGERPNKPDVAAIIREAQNSTEVRAHVAFLLIAFAYSLTDFSCAQHAGDAASIGGAGSCADERARVAAELDELCA
mgnify:CR=1 FL=1